MKECLFPYKPMFVYT